MNTRQWYYAHLRWAVMVEGKEGLRQWEEAVHVFLSADRETAFKRALEIGRLAEHCRREGRRQVESRLAQNRGVGLSGHQPDRVQGRSWIAQNDRTPAIPACVSSGGERAGTTLLTPLRSTNALINQVGRRRRAFLALTPVALRAPSVRAKKERKNQTLGGAKSIHRKGPNQVVKVRRPEQIAGCTLTLRDGQLHW